MIHALTVTLALAGATLATLWPAGAVLAQDAKAGEKKAAMCIGCHGLPGFKASFPEVYRVPMISGQNAKYLAAALEAYKRGERKHPTMRGVAGSLSEQDIADLSAFYASHGESSVKTVAATTPPAPPPKVAELLAKGACASCHGADFNKPIDPAYPKVGGLPADYLYAAMKAYQIVGNPHVGRGNPIMQAQMKPFTLAELRAMAAYIATLPGELRVVEQSKFR